jgi:hypothetical protein
MIIYCVESIILIFNIFFEDSKMEKKHVSTHSESEEYDDFELNEDNGSNKYENNQEENYIY